MLRIAVAVTVASGIGLLALAIALRQPVLATIPLRSGARADARRLEAHVRYLTTEVRPRTGPNLDRTAAFIAARFRASGGRTSLQTFEARGTPPRT